MAQLTCVLSSKVRESSKKPIQTAPGVPSIMHEASLQAMSWGEFQCILTHSLTLEVLVGLELEGL